MGFKIRVLWIDDYPDREFIKRAAQTGICISVKTDVESGIEALEDKSLSFDALILDANCITTDKQGEQPEIGALTYAIQEINRRQMDIPWFVYSGEGFEGDDSIEYIVPKNRPWDDRAFSRKDGDGDALLGSIKKAVTQFGKTRIRIKYGEICNLYQEQDLLELLSSYEDGDDDFDQDISVPNRIRGIMDWICFRYFNKVFKGSNLGECCKLVEDGRLNRFVPVYVENSFRLLTEYSNAGSHRFNNGKPYSNPQMQAEVQRGEGVRRDIGDGSARYLNRLALMALATVLEWCAELDENKTQFNRLQETISQIYSQSKRR